MPEYGRLTLMRHRTKSRPKKQKPRKINDFSGLADVDGLLQPTSSRHDHETDSANLDAVRKVVDELAGGGGV
jgi:hypothetical protein